MPAEQCRGTLGQGTEPTIHKALWLTQAGLNLPLPVQLGQAPEPSPTLKRMKRSGDWKQAIQCLTAPGQILVRTRALLSFSWIYGQAKIMCFSKNWILNINIVSLYLSYRQGSSAGRFIFGGNFISRLTKKIKGAHSRASHAGSF